MVWPTLYKDQNQESNFHCIAPQQLLAIGSDSELDHICALDIRSCPATIRLTAIACVIGPASSSVEILEKMIQTGMNVACFDFDRNLQAFYIELINNIRTAIDNYRRKTGTDVSLPLAMYIKGPQIKTGNLLGGPDQVLKLEQGNTIKLTSDKAYKDMGNADYLYVDYDNISKVVLEGHRIYLDGGLILLICNNIQGSILTCTIQNDGKLGSRRKVNLIDSKVDLPPISDVDKSDLWFAIAESFDIVIVSYTQNAQTITDVRNFLKLNNSSHVTVVAKIENEGGVDNIDGIIKEADGIFIGRGDLGVEITSSKLFLAQKSIIAKCNVAGKPVMCGDQLLSSMVNKLKPQRNEVLDVANAVLDGADCLVLTSETESGEYPIESINMMEKICKEAEATLRTKQIRYELVKPKLPPLNVTEAVGITASKASITCLAAAIIVLSRTGRSAVSVTMYKPKCPIIIVTRFSEVAKLAHLHRGLIPLHYSEPVMKNWKQDVDARISYAINFGKEKGFIKSGDPVVIVHGAQQGLGQSNTIRVVYALKSHNDSDCE